MVILVILLVASHSNENLKNQEACSCAMRADSHVILTSPAWKLGAVSSWINKNPPLYNFTFVTSLPNIHLRYTRCCNTKFLLFQHLKILRRWPPPMTRFRERRSSGTQIAPLGTQARLEYCPNSPTSEKRQEESKDKFHRTTRYQGRHHGESRVRPGCCCIECFYPGRTLKISTSRQQSLVRSLQQTQGYSGSRLHRGRY